MSCRRHTLAVLSLGALWLGSCRSTSAPALPHARATLVWHDAPSEAGTWSVRWSSPTSPLPLLEPCELRIEIQPRDGGPPPEDLSLRVDAGMPAHGHGTLRSAQVQALGDGRFRVEGLYLHMPGAWKLYLDVGSQGVFERSEISIEVD